MKIIEKSWNDFWAQHWRIDHRHQIPGIYEWDRTLVDFIEYVCELTPPARILDLGCGGGDQAKLFAQKGYKVLGIDIAPSLIEFATKQFEEETLTGEFIVGDMKQIKYDSEFNACVLLSGTFGFFSDYENQELLNSISKALKPGGKVFIMFLSVHRTVEHIKSWSESEVGWELTENWFDNENSKYCSRIFIITKDGTIIKPSYEAGYHANETIRCYSIPELSGMLQKADLKYLSSYSNRNLSLPPEKLSSNTDRNIIVGLRQEK